jgi:large subunit ribosomal protein L4
VTFAKTPVDHTYRLPRKAVQLATRMAILSKFEDNQVTLLDELQLATPKTRDVAQTLKALKLEGTSCLLALAGADGNVWKSARNIPRVAVSPAAELNAYEVLHKKQLVLTRGALDAIRERIRAAEAVS